MLIRSVLLFTGFFIALNANAQTAAGKTLVARGTVNAISAEGVDTRKLKRRSPIFSNDVVSTGANAKAQLRMTDGGMIALKENSELMIADYKFSDDSGRGSVAMELLKGGLRSVTGSIKAESGDYKLKTPVGSIGIRGTHYEVEIVGGTIWVAVWDGAVDLDITSGDQAGTTLSLGQTEGYSYASISPQGKVTTFIEPPQTFETGMTTEADEIDQNDEEDGDEETEEQSSDSTVASGTTQVAITTQESDDSESDDEETTTDDNEEVASDDGAAEDGAADEAPTEIVETNPEDSDGISSDSGIGSASDDTATEQAQADANNSTLPAELDIDDELDFATAEFNTAKTEIETLLDERVGEFEYKKVDYAPGDIVTQSGEEIANFEVSMTIDFDRGTVPEGNMAFDDSDGSWFATFDGVINVDEIDLDITYASHGDNLATGTIDMSFVTSLEDIHSNFTLEEIANPDVWVTGNFKFK